MTYDNRANKVNGFLRYAFREAPITTWSVIAFLVGMIVLTVLFPEVMVLVDIVLFGMLGLMGLIGLIIKENLNRIDRRDAR